MSRKVCIVTAGHLSTCPRMLKAADALHGRLRVRVVSACTRRGHSGGHAPGRCPSVTCARAPRAPVCIRPGCAPACGTASREHRPVSPQSAPAAIASEAFARAHRELVTAVLEERRSDHGGSTGAIAAAAEPEASGPPSASISKTSIATSRTRKTVGSERPGRTDHATCAPGRGVCHGGSAAIAARAQTSSDRRRRSITSSRYR
jgi:hypothetical protein